MKQCTACGEMFPRDDMTAKRVEFTTIGTKGKWRRIKSRTVAHLCDACREKDSDWNVKPYSHQRGDD